MTTQTSAGARVVAVEEGELVFFDTDANELGRERLPNRPKITTAMDHPWEVLETLGLGDRVQGDAVGIDGVTLANHIRAGIVWTTTLSDNGSGYDTTARTGRDATVTATAEAPAGRGVATYRQMPLSDLLRLCHAGYVPTVCHLDHPGVSAFGVCLREIGGEPWYFDARRLTGAPAALIDRSLCSVLLPEKKPRGMKSAPEIDRARVSSRRIASEGSPLQSKRWEAARSVVAGAAIDYLDKVGRGDEEDRGQPPVGWEVRRGRDVYARGGTRSPNAALGRLARIRSVAAAALAVDISGRSKTGAKGSTQRLQSTSAPMVVEDPYTGERKVIPGDDAGTIYGEALNAGSSFWSADPHNRSHMIPWHDPTGDFAVALADGLVDIGDAAAMLGESLGEDLTGAVARWMQVGLTKRRAEVLLRKGFGMTEDEIAAALGISRGTVAATVSAARRYLRDRAAVDEEWWSRVVNTPAKKSR